MRSSAIKQGMEVDFFKDKEEPSKVPVIFLDGEIHKKRRAQLARYFTPKAIKDRHRKVMDQTTDELIAQLRRKGEGKLDVMSLRLASDVAAEIVGLTATDPDAMSNRLRKKFTASGKRKRPGLLGKLGAFEDVVRTLWFFRRDVVPAIRHRQMHDMDDVISYLVREGYSDQEVLIECIDLCDRGDDHHARVHRLMCAWHLLEKDDLRRQFLDGGERTCRFAILDEILRIDPVAAYASYRKAEEDTVTSDGKVVKAGEQFLVDIRNINIDEEATGACPSRSIRTGSKRERMPSNWMSFCADGPHRCSGRPGGDARDARVHRRAAARARHPPHPPADDGLDRGHQRLRASTARSWSAILRQAQDERTVAGARDQPPLMLSLSKHTRVTCGTRRS